jgi:predicted phage terminase large subunit-like protein
MILGGSEAASPLHRFALAVTKRIGLEVAFCLLIQELKREGLLYIRAYEAPAGTDKIMRLFSQSHHFESGKVMLPGTASWLDDYRRELTSFPGSKHDDQVDSTTPRRSKFHGNGQEAKSPH